jgi:hypothetical protein
LGIGSNLMPDFGLGVFVPNHRSIGGILADVTIDENERDDVTTTRHPVEQGAPIADHAFKEPEEVVIRAGWNEAKSGDLSAETGIYGILLNWQASFVLFDLYTGKRRHKNMLIAGMVVTTDEGSEYSLMVTMTLREIILTKTQTTQTAASSNPNNHADPSSTPATVNLGPKNGEVIDSSSGLGSWYK